MCSDTEFENLDAGALFDLGKAAFKGENYGRAAECFSRALEAKFVQLHIGVNSHRSKGLEPDDPALGVYYLWFADALLCKEESSQQLLEKEADKGMYTLCQKVAKIVMQGAGETLPQAESVLEPQTSDEEIAFETWQLAYKCYQRLLESNLEANEGKEGYGLSEQDVLDASFCCMRLGDMYLSNVQFSEAANEYQKALDIRQAHALAPRLTAPVMLSLAQAQMFDARIAESLETFKRTKSLLELALQQDGLEDEDQRRSMQEALEDVQIQVQDLTKQAEMKAVGDKKGSQSNASECLPKTTGHFDPKTTDAVAVHIGTLERDANVTGKRRIDLSALVAPGKARSVADHLEGSTGDSIKGGSGAEPLTL